jgi:Ca-activated chloride channel family protein
MLLSQDYLDIRVFFCYSWVRLITQKMISTLTKRRNSLAEKEEGKVTIEPGLADLALKEIDYQVETIGLQSEIEVIQKFGNSLDHPIEAIYVFPLQDEAIVLGVEMTIGNKKISSELKERQKAREEYEQAVEAGHHASLLEQERPNIFTMSVGGIEPGEEISVKVKCLCPVPWQDSGGRLRIPLVVAPRFIPGTPIGKTGGGWAEDTVEVPDASKITPKVAESVSYGVNIDLKLSPGFTAYLESPTHGTIIEARNISENETAELKVTGIQADRDFIITYKTQSALPTIQVDRSTWSKDGQKEEFALVQLVSGYEVSKKPIEAVFCLDRSGSMAGPKIDGLKRITRMLLDQLEKFPQEVQVGIIIYDTEIEELIPLSKISKEHRDCLDKFDARDGTDIGPALTIATRMFPAKASKDKERCIVLISDGQSEKSDFRPVSGIRIHVVGIDTAVNDTLLKEYAQKSGGANEWVYPGEDYGAVANRLTALVSGPVVQEVALEGLPSEAIAVGISDLFAARPTTITIKLTQPISTFEVTGRMIDGQAMRWKVDLPAEPTTEIGPQLFCKLRMRELNNPKEQTSLSLKYGVLGPTTAFVAVSEKEVPGQKPERVEIPVLLPHTWEFDKIFGGSAYRGVALASLGVDAFGHVALKSTGHGLLSDDLGPTLGYTPSAKQTSGKIRPQPKPKPKEATKEPKLLPMAIDLVAVCRTNDQQKIDSDWKDFLEELEKENQAQFSGWSEVDLAKLYLYMVVLRDHGLKVAIPPIVSAEPTDKGSAAYPFWSVAQKELGKVTK